MTSQTSLPALSVVVIGRNEGQRLAACMEAIKQVRGVRVHEVIYADSASSDGSPERARGLGAKVIELRPKRPTAAIGRNAGWRQAASEFVLLLDGDTVVHPDFPRAAAEALAEDASIAAVWGNLREVRPRASIYNRILDLDWDYAPGFTEFCGGNVMMRRAALERTGGFDEHLIAGEEPELCRRIRACGYKILHIDHPMAWHDLNMMRFGQYWKRSTRTGHAYAEVSQRFRQSADPFWAADRRRNLIRGSFWILSLVAVLLAWIWAGPLPVVLWFALLFGLSARSAWKARWKKSDAVTLLLYGLHSHLQQVPIFVGQLQYAWNHRQGKKLELIEYKESN